MQKICFFAPTRYCTNLMCTKSILHLHQVDDGTKLIRTHKSLYLQNIWLTVNGNVVWHITMCLGCFVTYNFVFKYYLRFDVHLIFNPNYAKLWKLGLTLMEIKFFEFNRATLSGGVLCFLLIFISIFSNEILIFRYIMVLIPACLLLFNRTNERIVLLEWLFRRQSLIIFGVKVLWR